MASKCSIAVLFLLSVRSPVTTIIVLCTYSDLSPAPTAWPQARARVCSICCSCTSLLVSWRRSALPHTRRLQSSFEPSCTPTHSRAHRGHAKETHPPALERTRTNRHSLDSIGGFMPGHVMGYTTAAAADICHLSGNLPVQHFNRPISCWFRAFASIIIMMPFFVGCIGDTHTKQPSRPGRTVFATCHDPAGRPVLLRGNTGTSQTKACMRMNVTLPSDLS